MSFTLRFPFEIPPGFELSELNQEARLNWGSYTLELSQDRGYYVITISGLDSADAGATLAQSLWAALSWVMLKRALPFQAAFELGTIMYAPDPEAAAINLGATFNTVIEPPLHGLFEAHEPVVYETDKQFRSIAIGKVSATVGLPAPTLLGDLLEALAFANISGAASDARLITALDLFRGHLVESTPNGRLLMLVMSLEALTEPKRKADIALRFLQKWHEDLDTCSADPALTQSDREAIDALKREVLFRKDESIRQAFKRTVFEILSETGDPEAAALASRALKVYDHRSTLIHEGSIDSQDLRLAQRDAFTIASKVLESKLKAQAKALTQSQ